MDGEPQVPNVQHTQMAEQKHFSEHDHLRQEQMCVCLCGQNLYTLSFGDTQDKMLWKRQSQGQSHVWILNLRTCGGLCLKKALLTHLSGPWVNKALSKRNNLHRVLWAFDKTVADPEGRIG